MSGLRQTPLYRALHRPQLLMGGDRKLMIVTLALTALLVVVSANKVTIILGILIFLISVYALRKAAKADPFMWPVYLRHSRYKGYYAPFSRPWRDAKDGRDY